MNLTKLFLLPIFTEGSLANQTLYPPELQAGKEMV